jgi:hypothetical protein
MPDPTGQRTAEAANRAMNDPAFAQQVLESDDYPAVKAALLADLAEADESAEVSGFQYTYDKPSVQVLERYISLQSPFQFVNVQGLQERAARW